MKAGVIGLGAMGGPMAKNLHRAGFLAAVWNRTRATAEALAAETGVAVVDTPAQLASCVDLILTSVSRDQDLKAVITALLPGARADTVVVDTSTISAEAAREMAARLAEQGGWFLDAPISGGVEGAKSGRLAMMVGGNPSVLERVRAPLSSVAATIAYMGPSGCGQATKAVNQIMAAGISQAVTEALALGEALGLDMDKVIEIVSQGAAGNWFLDHRGKTMVAGRYVPGFKLALHHKDLEICRALAGDGKLPIVDLTLADYQYLMAEGLGDADISALYLLKRRLLGLGDGWRSGSG